jgi:hypothetical protein
MGDDLMGGSVVDPAGGRRSPGGWSVVAAAVQGASHRMTGQSCQDAYHWRRWSTAGLVAAVADGAGSALHGEVGARLASREAVEYLCACLEDSPLPEADCDWQRLLAAALARTREVLDQAAAERGIPLRDLATTLILVVALPERVALAQVGDGAAVVTDSGGALVVLSEPQVREYVNETVFLTSPEALATAQKTVWQGTGSRTQIALLSDGLQMLALRLQDGMPHGPFFAPLYRFAFGARDDQDAPQRLAAFLGSKAVAERTSDDVTLLIASFG